MAKLEVYRMARYMCWMCYAAYGDTGEGAITVRSTTPILDRYRVVLWGLKLFPVYRYTSWLKCPKCGGAVRTWRCQAYANLIVNQVARLFPLDAPHNVMFYRGRPIGVDCLVGPVEMGASGEPTPRRGRALWEAMWRG